MRSGKIMTRKISAVEVSGHSKQWIEPHLKLQLVGIWQTPHLIRPFGMR